MKLYADASPRRTRQVVGDVLFVAWLLLWLWLANVVHDATLALATPGRKIESAAGDLSDKLRGAGSAVDGIPLVGDQVRSPFDGAGRAADQIAAAGTSQVEAVQHLAFWLGFAVAAIPVLLLVVLYVPRRVRFARTAGATQRFVDGAADLDLFALRAMAHQPVRRLAAVSDDPVRAWRAGDAAVVRALALLELEEAGLTPPPPVAGPTAG
jgi:hypothetical protein